MKGVGSLSADIDSLDGTASGDDTEPEFALGVTAEDLAELYGFPSIPFEEIDQGRATGIRRTTRPRNVHDWAQRPSGDRKIS